jgi:hypothetical protein
VEENPLLLAKVIVSELASKESGVKLHETTSPTVMFSSGVSTLRLPALLVTLILCVVGILFPSAEN